MEWPIRNLMLSGFHCVFAGYYSLSLIPRPFPALCATIDIRDYVHGFGNKIIAQMMFVVPFLKNFVGLSHFTPCIRGAKTNARKHYGNYKITILG